MTYECSLISCGFAERDRTLGMDDYAGAVARWCPGCGDHSVLTAVERLLESEQLPPESTVFVSGIGCSSRFPHYLKTYGFHGLHGRALPVATGIRLERPDLDVFVVMGDGDCYSIGAGHWLHAMRYNTHMVAMVLDNGMYGLTKGQTSPTTPEGMPSNTQPRGSYLRELNPLSAVLGITNASFVAQTAEWIPAHLYETLRTAYRHPGFAFVRILQRCPIYAPKVYEQTVRDPGLITLLLHENGIQVPSLEKVYENQVPHDPSDLHGARRLAEPDGVIRLGLLYRNTDLPRYDEIRRLPTLTAEERIRRLDEELDRYAI